MLWLEEAEAHSAHFSNDTPAASIRRIKLWGFVRLFFPLLKANSGGDEESFPAQPSLGREPWQRESTQLVVCSKLLTARSVVMWAGGVFSKTYLGGFAWLRVFIPSLIIPVIIWALHTAPTFTRLPSHVLFQTSFLLVFYTWQLLMELICCFSFYLYLPADCYKEVESCSY